MKCTGDLEEDIDKTHWMIVTSPDNFEQTRALGFTVQGIKSRHRKKAEKMQSGDRVVYYLTGLQSFGGTATITGSYYEDHRPIWRSRPGEDYPWRFPITPAVIGAPDHYPRAEALLDQLEFVQRWPRAHWHLAFQGNVHVLPGHDFTVIEDALLQGLPAGTSAGATG